MQPFDQLIRINIILYRHKECDKTFKESEHIRPQLLQSFDFTIVMYSLLNQNQTNWCVPLSNNYVCLCA